MFISPWREAFRTESVDAAACLISRNLVVDGRRTSMRLEPSMWAALDEVCRREGKSSGQVVTEIDRGRREATLTAAVRVFLLRYFWTAATDEGHRFAGHGPTTSHGSPARSCREGSLLERD